MSDAEIEVQRRERALRAAMATPIGAAAVEARSVITRASTERPGTDAAAASAPAGPILAAAAVAAHAAATGVAPETRQAAMATDRPEMLPAIVGGPESPYDVKAGTIIPAVLLTGLNSDLPGQLIGQVREPVFDTEAGQHLLIPQGARLIGLYDHQVLHGQARVLVTWKRIMFPNGTSLSLKDGMPGADAAGAAASTTSSTCTWPRVFSNALLLSVFNGECS